MPYGADNALVKAAEVVSRLADYRPAPYVDELWRGFVDSLGLDPALKAALVDPGRASTTPSPTSRRPGRARVVGHPHHVLAERRATAA